MAVADPLRKAVSIAVAIGLATSATAALAKGPAKPPAGQGSAALAGALNQMGASSSQVQNLKKVSGDRDQGDENASPRAKERVCSKNTPASRRSAICNPPESPG
jgi:hypothetical protein